MVSIDADNRDAHRAIERLVTLSKACGGAFSHDITVRCRKGSLSITARGKDENVIMRLPRRCLLSLDQFDLALDRDELSVNFWSENAPPLHIQMADALVDLYNICGKAKTHRSVSSWLFLAEQPELAAFIGKARDNDLTRGFLNLGRTGVNPGLELNTFLMTRVIRIDGILALMPMAELVNHSALAHPFYFPPPKDGGGVAVRRKKFPERFGDECFVRYGHHDSLDSWLIHNFVEEHAKFARSVPLEIDLGGRAKIRVHAEFGTGHHDKLPPELEDLRDDLPNIRAKTADSIDISFLLIPAAHSDRLRRALRWVISQLLPGHDEIDSLVASAEAQVLDKNWAYYEALRQQLKTVALKNPAKKPLLDSLNNLCALQLARLIEYGK